MPLADGEITASIAQLTSRMGEDESILQDRECASEEKELRAMGDVVGKAEACPSLLNDSRPTTEDELEQLVFVIEDSPGLSRSIALLCDYLGIRLETVSSRSDLKVLLSARRPMAVMSPMDTPTQDGCHVLKTVAAYDRNLPVLLVTGKDPVVLGAVEAVEEIWQLGQVQKATAIPSLGDFAEFLSKAGRRSSRGLMAA